MIVIRDISFGHITQPYIWLNIYIYIYIYIYIFFVRNLSNQFSEPLKQNKNNNNCINPFDLKYIRFILIFKIWLETIRFVREKKLFIASFVLFWMRTECIPNTAHHTHTQHEEFVVKEQNNQAFIERKTYLPQSY